MGASKQQVADFLGYIVVDGNSWHGSNSRKKNTAAALPLRRIGTPREVGKMRMPRGGGVEPGSHNHRRKKRSPSDSERPPKAVRSTVKHGNLSRKSHLSLALHEDAKPRQVQSRKSECVHMRKTSENDGINQSTKRDS